MKKIHLCIYVFMLLCSFAVADTVTLNYSQCASYTILNPDNSTSNVSICAPAQNICLPPPAINLTLNYSQTTTQNNFTCSAPAYPSHHDFNLNYDETADANNVTAHCRAFDSSACPAPVCSSPPAVALNLTYGQTVTLNNFTASCPAWSNASCPAQQQCSPPGAVTETLPWGITHTINNYTCTCKAWDNSSCPADPSCPLTGLENQSITAGPGYHLWNPLLNFTLDVPYINNIYTLNPGDIFNLTFNGYNYKAVFVCSNSSAFCPAPNLNTLCTPWVNTANCTNFSTCNATATPSCAAMLSNLSSSSNCSMKIPICLGDLAGTSCTADNLLNGSVQACINKTTADCQSQVTTLQTTNTQCNSKLTDQQTSFEAGKNSEGQTIGEYAVVTAAIFAVVFIFLKRGGGDKATHFIQSSFFSGGKPPQANEEKEEESTSRIRTKRGVK